MHYVILLAILILTVKCGSLIVSPDFLVIHVQSISSGYVIV